MGHPAGKSCEQCGNDIGAHWYGRRFCQACAQARQANPLARKAHRAVSSAVRRGELPPAKTQPCADCGKPAYDYDHRDYSKPLEVQPVCRSCNRLRGPAIGSYAASEAA